MGPAQGNGEFGGRVGITSGREAARGPRRSSPARSVLRLVHFAQARPRHAEPSGAGDAPRAAHRDCPADQEARRRGRRGELPGGVAGTPEPRRGRRGAGDAARSWRHRRLGCRKSHPAGPPPRDPSRGLQGGQNARLRRHALLPLPGAHHRRVPLVQVPVHERTRPRRRVRRRSEEVTRRASRQRQGLRRRG